MTVAREQAARPRLDRWGTLNAFVDDQLAGLTREIGASAGLVWVTLFRLASGTDGKASGASERRLSELTGLSRPTIRSACKALISRGFVGIERDATRRAAPVYVVAGGGA